MELVANFCLTLYSDEPPDPWPPPSTILVSRLFEEARYEKSDYFRRLQLATNWTSRAHTYTGLSVSGQCHAICAIGDSVIGEVGTRFKRVLANRKCPVPVAWHVHSIWTLRAQDALPMFTRHACPIVVLGGLGLHHLLRSVNTTSTPTMHPFNEHAHYFSSLLSDLVLWANATNKKVILLGTGRVDELTLLSNPAKENWFGFYPFRLLPLWRKAELDAMADMHANLMASQQKRIFYLDTDQMNARYPGIRCDGMHYMSEFKDFNAGRAMVATSSIVPLQAGSLTLSAGLNISQAASEEAISAVRQAKREQGSCRNTNETCSCFNSAAAWDWYLLRALEALGSIERVSNQSWRWK